MKIFLIVLLVSFVSSSVLWNFGLAARIWPSHPLLATTGLALLCAMAVQLVLTYEAAGQKNR